MVAVVADNVGIELLIKLIIFIQINRAKSHIQDCSIKNNYCVTLFILYIDFYMYNTTD